MTNHDRTELGRRSAEAFADATRTDLDDDCEEILTDLVVNLMHYAQRNGVAPRQVLHQALGRVENDEFFAQPDEA